MCTSHIHIHIYVYIYIYMLFLQDMPVTGIFMYSNTQVMFTRVLDCFSSAHTFDSYLKDKIVKGGFPCNFSSSECHPNDEYLHTCQQE